MEIIGLNDASENLPVVTYEQSVTRKAWELMKFYGDRTSFIFDDSYAEGTIIDIDDENIDPNMFSETEYFSTGYFAYGDKYRAQIDQIYLINGVACRELGRLVIHLEELDRQVTCIEDVEEAEAIDYEQILIQLETHPDGIAFYRGNSEYLEIVKDIEGIKQIDRLLNTLVAYVWKAELEDNFSDINTTPAYYEARFLTGEKYEDE